VVGLNRTGGKQHIGTLTQGIGGEEFEFSEFIATERNGREVIPFDKNIAAEVVRQAWQMLQRRGRTQQLKLGE
jgi:hypothetical protein